jgi:RNA polymerase sigma-70 factor (ECF subfamily)
MADVARDETSEPKPGGPAQTPAFEDVMALHETALLRYAARLLNNADAAQDVVQETFIRLHRRWGPGGPQGDHILPWLYRTAHNAAVDFIRREERLRALHEKAVEESGPPVTLPATDDPAERTRLALEHLARLAPGEREVLVLRLQEGLSYQDISRATGRTVGNVGCLLHHAVKKLSANLKRAGVL